MSKCFSSVSDFTHININIEYGYMNVWYRLFRQYIPHMWPVHKYFITVFAVMFKRCLPSDSISCMCHTFIVFYVQLSICVLHIPACFSDILASFFCQSKPIRYLLYKDMPDVLSCLRIVFRTASGPSPFSQRFNLVVLLCVCLCIYIYI